MAKKKEIQIVDKELTPTVLAVVESKKKVSVFGMVWIFIIFLLLILGTLYLPEISNYVSNKINPGVSDDYGDDSSVINNKDEDDALKEETTEYNISENPVIDTDNFQINNIVLNNNTITFNITNKTTQTLNFDEENYFLSLYSSSKTLLERIMINNVILNSGEAKNLSYNIQSANISIISLNNIKTEEYPAFTAVGGLLTCTKDYETIKYLFNDNKLYGIQDIYEVPVSDENYANLYATYNLLSQSYTSLDGVQSSVTTENDVLKFQTIIGFRDSSVAINKREIYSKDTDAKIIKFELESSGYACK